MTLGVDFSVAFSPERLLMGRVIEDLTKYPKVVGGVDAEGGARAAAFYREVFGGEVYELSNAETAELTKLAEGAYRDLNIALANELAQVADIHGVDISEVIRAANSQPYSHLHMPGTGVGGHCIPVYPQFLMQGEGPSALSALGRQVNDAMPGYAVQRVEQLLGNLAGARVLILGLTFRPNVAVTPHTNAVDLLREFEARGALVRGHDALLSEAGVRALGFEPVEALTGFDVAVVHAYHREYEALDWATVAPLVVDARNALDRRSYRVRGRALPGDRAARHARNKRSLLPLSRGLAKEASGEDEPAVPYGRATFASFGPSPSPRTMRNYSSPLPGRWPGAGAWAGTVRWHPPTRPPLSPRL